jgi:hypothetical protein
MKINVGPGIGPDSSFENYYETVSNNAIGGIQTLSPRGITD